MVKRAFVEPSLLDGFPSHLPAQRVHRGAAPAVTGSPVAAEIRPNSDGDPTFGRDRSPAIPGPRFGPTESCEIQRIGEKMGVP